MYFEYCSLSMHFTTVYISPPPPPPPPRPPSLPPPQVDLMINLPLRQHRSSPAITKGYVTRRMAVEYSVPLVTDIKCAKLLVQVSEGVRV